MLSRELDDRDEPTERLDEDARLHLEFHAARVRTWAIVFGAITLLMGFYLLAVAVSRSGSRPVGMSGYLLAGLLLCMFGIACCVSGAMIRAGRKLLAGVICFAALLAVFLIFGVNVGLQMDPSSARGMMVVRLIFILELIPHIVLGWKTFRKAWEMGNSIRLEQLNPPPKAFEVQMPEVKE